MLEMPQFGVSSSAVRERAAAGRPLRYLVPEAVARFIEEKGIYRERRAGGSSSPRRWRGGWPSWPTRKAATEIVVLDMRELVSYTDFLAICTARNERQARAIVDEVKLRLKQEHGLLPGGVDGEGAAGWIVLDYLDAVLHVFTAEERQRYQLEDLWREAPRLELQTAAGWRPRAPLRCRAWVASRGRFLGYRRAEVDAAIAARDARTRRSATRGGARALARGRRAAAAEEELASLSGMVIEREREIRGLRERLREANERHERSIASLEAVSARLEEIQAQARGQATRIRMKALREAVEVGRRAQELTEAAGGAANGASPSCERQRRGRARASSSRAWSSSRSARSATSPSWSASRTRSAGSAPPEISVERFSEGRATLSMRLDEPVDLLRELEERSPLDFNVRRTADDNLVLDVDDDDPEQRAA